MRLTGQLWLKLVVKEVCPMIEGWQFKSILEQDVSPVVLATLCMAAATHWCSMGVCECAGEWGAIVKCF